MKFKHILTVSAISLSVMAAPVFAQDGEEEWEGGYIGGSFGLAAQENDRGESVLFDTNRDGTFDDGVFTTTGANAFSTGFCRGSATSRVAADGCRGDRDGKEYNIRAGYDIQQGNIVYGFVLEGGKNQARDSVTAFSTTPANYTFTRELEYSA